MKLSIEQLARMSRLLDEVIDLDAAGRQAWLQALPAEHRDIEAALRQALLPQDGEAAGVALLDQPLKIGGDKAASRWHAGELVGPYRLIRPLGAGGMAEVWLAERADGAFKRQVALKMPASLERREELARRFVIERDILAALEHPHIARFYDAGASQDGTPYLALEYVAGSKLLQWADERRLAIRERIQLFLQVLEAVQYAHDKGVLHRDIKPGNVLVTVTGQVHLLDFGVARFMERPAEAELTKVYGRALTPEYASPEQLKGEGIGAASDVYSLGVMLGELLSGRQPHQAARVTPEPDLERPSTRLDADAAEARGGSIARIRRTLRGDLDAIVLKALASSPSGRYESAAALAQDLRRYLAGQAVQAVPHSLPYTAGKLLTRNRARVAQALAVAVVIGTIYEVVHRQQPARAPVAAVAAASSAAQASSDKPSIAPPAVKEPNLEAYNLVLEGDVYANGPYQRDAERAENLFKQAIALDPGYALPWVRLGLLHMRKAYLASTTKDEEYGLARRAIDAALRIDPNLMAAHAARFRYAVRVDYRWADARAALDRMRTIDPRDAVSLPDCEAYYARIVGKLDEAIRIQKQLIERDPLNSSAIGTLASYLLESDRFEESLTLFQAELALNPHAIGNHGLIGVNLALLGRGDLALAEIGKERHDSYRLWALSIAYWTMGRRDESDVALQEMKKFPNANAYYIGQLYAIRGKRNSTFEWLSRACAERQSGCELLRTDRFLRNVRDDARYRALLVKMKLNGDPPPSAH